MTGNHARDDRTKKTCVAQLQTGNQIHQDPSLNLQASKSHVARALIHIERIERISYASRSRAPKLGVQSFDPLQFSVKGCSFVRKRKEDSVLRLESR